MRRRRKIPLGDTAKASADRFKAAIRDVPDFPKPGIVFKDITPLLADAELFADACEELARPFRGDDVSHVVAVESRGFIFGAPVASLLGCGFVPVRKVGKLPFRTERITYDLEYGTDSLEMHVDACAPPARVVVVDDVLATGGTAAATCRLVERVGATVVGCSFLIALSFLPGAKALAGRRFAALITY